MILPELPAYLSALGGEDYKGLIIALFTLTAGLSRPFSGKLTDTVGRMPVMIIGTLVCVVCSLFYPFVGSVWAFLLLRFLHGFSTGFKPTASTAYTADIAPVNRRGEAMGILSLSMNTGASIAPAFGSWLAAETSLEWMFYTSSFMALLSVLILLGLKETLVNKQRFQLASLRLKASEILDRSAYAPALIIALMYLGYGAILTIIPDQSDYLGFSNKGVFYSCFTLCSLASRVLAGRISDSMGRLPVIRFGLWLLVVSQLLLAYAPGPVWFLIASGIVGFAHGVANPAVFAWTIDRCSDEHRGRAMATVYIALEVGIGFGALGSAWLYNNNPQNFSLAFLVISLCTLPAAMFVWYRTRRGSA